MTSKHRPEPHQRHSSRPLRTFDAVQPRIVVPVARAANERWRALAQARLQALRCQWPAQPLHRACLGLGTLCYRISNQISIDRGGWVMASAPIGKACA